MNKMRDDLMPVEIEIDPVLGATPFRTAEDAAVEAPRRIQIVDRKCEMEGMEAHRRIDASPRHACPDFPPG